MAEVAAKQVFSKLGQAILIGASFEIGVAKQAYV